MLRHGAVYRSGARKLYMCDYQDLQHLHSFPTRRSSDLVENDDDVRPESHVPSSSARCGERSFANCHEIRSEEHTSEHQSPVHLVCRLLLEQKKRINLIEEDNNQPEKRIAAGQKPDAACR